MSDPANHNTIDPSANLRGFLSASGRRTLQAIETIRGKYITSPGDAVCMKALTRLILNAGLRANPRKPHARTNRREGRILVITGESGAGKSHRLMRTLRRHPALQGQDLEGPHSPVVIVNVPSPCTLKLLGRETLAVTGYPLQRDLRENLTWDRVRNRLDKGDKLIVVYDEMQHITQTPNPIEREKIANTIKDLMINRKWRVSVIVCGLPAVADFIHGDIQLKRRARFIHLASLKMPDDNPVIAAMVTALARVAELTVEADIETNLAPRLIHAAGDQWGIAIELTHEAIEMALRPDYLKLAKDEDEIDIGSPQEAGPDGTLTQQHFAQAFEDILGCTDDENPFVARDWTTIRIAEPTAILGKSKAQPARTRATAVPS